MGKNLADAYKSYEEGRLVHDKRLQQNRNEVRLRSEAGAIEIIREYLHEEPVVRELPKPQRDRLSELLDVLYSEERTRLSAPIRFAREQIKNITFRIRRK